MQSVSNTYRQLWNAGARTESRLLINDVEYIGDNLIELKTSMSAFGQYGNMTIGKAPSRMMTARVRWQGETIPDRALCQPQIRLTDGTTHSEWLSKGLFYIDTKTPDYLHTYLDITAYDALMTAEAPYGYTALNFPALARDVMDEIAGKLGVDVDSRTYEYMTTGWAVASVEDMTLREVLGEIAGLYLGCFVMSDVGELLLISMRNAPATRVLGDNSGNAISVGGVLIGV